MKLEGEFNRPLSSIVCDVKTALRARFPSGIHLIILYGSEARGEARPDFDLDLLVVLERNDPQLKEGVRTAAYDVMWRRDFDRLISLYVLCKEEFEAQRQKGYSFIRAVEHDGVVLWKAA